MSQTLQPASTERIILLDVLRGFAIFGIFVVNIEIMNCFLVEEDSCYAGEMGLLNGFADELRRLFFYTKFFPIFSMLFGVGVGIQILSLHNKQQAVWPFIGRRMCWLLLIGVCHIVFLWTGDVVHLYAVIGFSGPLLYRLPPKILLGLALLMLIAFPWLSIPLYKLVWSVMDWMAPGYAESFLSAYPEGEISRIMSQGSYAEQIGLRLDEYRMNLPVIWSYFAPLAFSMFLLGLFIAKTGIHHNLTRFAHSITKPVLLLALVTNIYRFFFLYYVLDVGLHRSEGIGPVLLGIMPVCDVVMGLFYLWFIAYFFPRFAYSKLSYGLASVGRTALSNYILQSMLGLLLVSSIGLGMYGQLTKWDSFLIALSVFPIQAGLSVLWLKRFRFGPLEWVWRCLTYKKLFALKKAN